MSETKNNKNKAEGLSHSSSAAKGLTRRDFLKVVGVGAGAMATTGCGPDLPEKIIPYVVQPDDIIPGKASWYAGTCLGCESACGVVYRVREGRVVKIEGNKNHPISQGGVCAKGHSLLQDHYSPDRISTPFIRNAKGKLEKSDWVSASKKLTDSIKNATGKTVLVTKKLQGSTPELVDKFKMSAPNIEHIELDILSDDSLARASKEVFGTENIEFDFNAKTIVSVGAGFLENWGNVVSNSRTWAESRKHHALHLHIEPRLSLTASNADTWIKNTPLTEKNILLALAKAVGEASGSSALLNISTEPVSKLLAGTGVEEKLIKKAAKKLVKSHNSLVVAGGPAISKEESDECAKIALAINAELGNVGKTVKLSAPVSGNTTHSEKKSIAYLLEASLKGEVENVIFADTNPAYSLSDSLKINEALANIENVFSLSLYEDETSEYANVLLPLSSPLESWADVDLGNGFFSLNQPSMSRLYDSISLEDLLIASISKLGGNIGYEVDNFRDYIKERRKTQVSAIKLSPLDQSQVDADTEYERKWLKVVEKGGNWFGGAFKKSYLQASANMASISGIKPSHSSSHNQNGHDNGGHHKKISAADLSLLAYPSVMSKDGSEANSPWMQEVPDPISQVTWGSWIEVHPKTAKSLGFKEGEVVAISTKNGKVEAPILLTPHIHEKVIATPTGKGHSKYGRYANGYGTNAFKALSMSSETGEVALLEQVEAVGRTVWKEDLVKIQEYSNQLNRGLLKSKPGDSHSKKKHDKIHAKTGSHHGVHGHGTPGQMYHQMEHPLYRWGMSVDLNSCVGCNACVVSCYAENNVPVVGRELVAEGREMSWLRIDRYFDQDENSTRPVEGFQPMMCQHCNNAPCEPVCPVYATYHTEEGLNRMVYNRCVGTRYCSNNCSYKVRRFNWFHYKWPEPLNWQLNPDVTVREVGVMEKCSMCIQRIYEAENRSKNEGRTVRDGEIETACSSSCPTKAITFGNLMDHSSEVYKQSHSEGAYKVLDHHINTQPGVSYIEKEYNSELETKKNKKKVSDHV